MNLRVPLTSPARTLQAPPGTELLIPQPNRGTRKDRLSFTCKTCKSGMQRENARKGAGKQAVNSAYAIVCITVASRGRSPEWDPAVLGTVQTQNKRRASVFRLPGTALLGARGGVRCAKPGDIGLGAQVRAQVWESGLGPVAL